MYSLFRSDNNNNIISGEYTTWAILLASRAIYSCIPRKRAIQYYIILRFHGLQPFIHCTYCVLVVWYRYYTASQNILECPTSIFVGGIRWLIHLILRIAWYFKYFMNLFIKNRYRKIYQDAYHVIYPVIKWLIIGYFMDPWLAILNGVKSEGRTKWSLETVYNRKLVNSHFSLFPFNYQCICQYHSICKTIYFPLGLYLTVWL